MIDVSEVFDAKDIEKSFSETIIDRGRKYARAGRVLDAWYDQWGDLAGKVKGSDFEPYEVEISFESRQRYLRLESSCTCPFGGQCKHGAALALYALGRELRTLDGPHHEPEDGNEALAAFEIALQRPQPSEVSLAISPPRDLRNWFNLVESATEDDSAVDPTAKQRVCYHLQLAAVEGGQAPTVAAMSRNILKSGSLGAGNEINRSSIGISQRPNHWTASDAALLKDLDVLCATVGWNKAVYRLDGRHGGALLRRILSTGRGMWEGSRPLTLGEPAEGAFEWQVAPKTGALTPILNVGPRKIVLGLERPWYVDPSTGECGQIETELPDRLGAALLRGGPILPEFVPAVRSQFEALGLPAALLPQETRRVVVRAPQPEPVLAIDFEACTSNIPLYSAAAQVSAPVAFAKLTFEYESRKAPADGDEIRIVSPGELLILRRNLAAERFAQEVLQAAGWQSTGYCGWEIPSGRKSSMCMVPPDNSRLMEPLQKVAEFAEFVAPRLVAAGWKVDVDQNIRYVSEEDVEWDVGLDGQSGMDWFEFQLGIRVEGERFDLRPILAEAFKVDAKRRLAGGGSRRVQNDDLFVFGLNGRAIKLSLQRLSAILQPLVELFGGVTDWPNELRLPKSRLPETEKLETGAGSAKIGWKTDDEVTRLRRQFANFDRLEPQAEPEGFAGELRGYQREGLAWLQFLREHRFGGVLADDMGLGKTVQVLAHIQTEKAAGRMDRPCLIVAPTSTMPNWRRETERFAPGLKVLTVQGSDRASRFADIEKADIVLTTYPLLARDKPKLLQSSYHLVVLDEAQNVKNPTTAAAKAARELNARHRLCLSGTPVENHLGELWSLFHFLMPGFLGSDAEFKKTFRSPIERDGDGAARERLARRLRPFMLRRTKGQVVNELPAKTVSVESVEFDDPQRDLYESIRVAMDERVRSLLGSQGFDKSRIQILDALLKLRQICCDPRLVKLPSAKSVASSAKLDRLMEMLRVLLEDGRRVLLFSQFTSMLDLIEERLRTDHVEWVRISGDTVDRDTPVRRFQSGAVPLFLISLKAGGTGLNLTAADTVILYDPWWNPAVENQAIDRAHRIGQEKAVIVYKLVASGTIEEKMLEIQARKGDIARAILADDAEGIRSLSADDLRWVFSKE